MQLAVRTSDFIFIDFNPTHEFWANTELENDPDSDWIVLTYKDNQAAPQAAINEILKAKDKAEKGNEFWANWYDVYNNNGTLVFRVLKESNPAHYHIESSK